MNHNQLLEGCQNQMGSDHPICLHENELDPVSEVINVHIRTKVTSFSGFEDVHHAVRVSDLFLMVTNMSVSGL